MNAKNFFPRHKYELTISVTYIKAVSCHGTGLVIKSVIAITIK